MVEYSDPYAEEDPPWAPRTYLEKGWLVGVVGGDGNVSPSLGLNSVQYIIQMPFYPENLRVTGFLHFAK